MFSGTEGEKKIKQVPGSHVWLQTREVIKEEKMCTEGITKPNKCEGCMCCRFTRHSELPHLLITHYGNRRAHLHSTDIVFTSTLFFGFRNE